MNKLILEKEQQIVNHERELNEYEQVAIAKDREINEIQLIVQDYESLKQYNQELRNQINEAREYRIQMEHEKQEMIEKHQ